MARDATGIGFPEPLFLMGLIFSAASAILLSLCGDWTKSHYLPGLTTGLLMTLPLTVGGGGGVEELRTIQNAP